MSATANWHWCSAHEPVSEAHASCEQEYEDKEADTVNNVRMKRTSPNTRRLSKNATTNVWQQKVNPRAFNAIDFKMKSKKSGAEFATTRSPNNLYKQISSNSRPTRHELRNPSVTWLVVSYVWSWRMVIPLAINERRRCEPVWRLRCRRLSSNISWTSKKNGVDLFASSISLPYGFHTENGQARP